MKLEAEQLIRMPESSDQTAHADFELALLTDVGGREGNEDACGHLIESASAIVFAVADGVGGYEGGEIASRMAVDLTLETYRDSPAAWEPAKRLLRAVQRANIEIYNRAITVPELRRMATTLTAVAVTDGMLAAAHVGDCRLYLVRGGRVKQMTKDHTWVGERVRMGLLSAKQARAHPERNAINRCLGHELIVSIDRILMPLARGDRLILCTDGLHGMVEDDELHPLTRGRSAQAACQQLIETANARGSGDNVTAAVFEMKAATAAVTPRRWHQRVLRLLRLGN